MTRKLIKILTLLLAILFLSLNFDSPSQGLIGEGEFPERRRVEIGGAVLATLPICQEDQVIVFKMEDGPRDFECRTFDDLVIEYLITRVT